jgi:hypothetical protein
MKPAAFDSAMRGVVPREAWLFALARDALMVEWEVE